MEALRAVEYIVDEEVRLREAPKEASKAVAGRLLIFPADMCELRLTESESDICIFVVLSAFAEAVER